MKGWGTQSKIKNQGGQLSFPGLFRPTHSSFFYDVVILFSCPQPDLKSEDNMLCYQSPCAAVHMKHVR